MGLYSEPKKRRETVDNILKELVARGHKVDMAPKSDGSVIERIVVDGFPVGYFMRRYLDRLEFVLCRIDDYKQQGYRTDKFGNLRNVNGACNRIEYLVDYQKSLADVMSKKRKTQELEQPPAEPPPAPPETILGDWAALSDELAKRYPSIAGVKYIPFKTGLAINLPILSAKEATAVMAALSLARGER